MKRFRLSIFAVLAVVVLAVAFVWTRPSHTDEELTPQLFAFDKNDPVHIEIRRPDRTLELIQENGQWKLAGLPWRPSRAMVRRIAHQIGNLKARAKVVDNPEKPAEYGLGDDAIHVDIELKDGRKVSFLVGDPNPTGVSYYLMTPDGGVFIVQKAALDYYSLTPDEFRERKYAWLDADDARVIEAEVDGRKMRFERLPDGPETRKSGDWRMTEPRSWSASIDEVRTMLGRVGSAKADEFVEDLPKDLAKYGLEPPRQRVRITMGTGETVTVRVGDLVPGKQVADQDPIYYVYRDEDESVYAGKAGFLEAYRLPDEQYRNPEIVDSHEWKLSSFSATTQGRTLTITRTADGWRWPDQAPISGSTPGRIAGSVAEMDALAFHDEPVAKTGFDDPYARFVLQLAGGREVRATVGDVVPGSTDLPRPPPPPVPPGLEGGPRPPPVSPPTTRRYVTVEGDPVVYEVAVTTFESLDDLFREYDRKVERDKEKRIREEAGLPPLPDEDEKPRPQGPGLGPDGRPLPDGPGTAPSRPGLPPNGNGMPPGMPGLPPGTPIPKAG